MKVDPPPLLKYGIVNRKELPSPYSGELCRRGMPISSTLCDSNRLTEGQNVTESSLSRANRMGGSRVQFWTCLFDHSHCSMHGEVAPEQRIGTTRPPELHHWISAITLLDPNHFADCRGGYPETTVRKVCVRCIVFTVTLLMISYQMIWRSTFFTGKLCCLFDYAPITQGNVSVIV